MVVPFGISVGDFIALGILFKDVSIALKDQGGAASQFQETQKNLETTQAILEELETFKSASGNITQVNAIRAQAQLVQQDVLDFLQKVRKYEDTLGLRSPKGVFRATGAKIRWSQYVTGQVNELARKVEGQISNIHLLLQLDLSGAASELAVQQKAHEKATIQNFARTTRLITDHAAQTKLLQCNVQTLGHDTLARVSDSHLDLSLQLDRFERRTALASDHLQNQMATALDIQELKDLLKLHFPRKSDSGIDLERPHALRRLMLTLTIPQLDISIRDTKVLFQHLLTEVEALLHLSFATFLLMLKDFLLVLPQLVIMVKVLQRLPQAISLVLHDNLSFEDALGRVHSLQFQQFRHWAIFEASLRCTFANQPGLQKVRKGHFLLTCSDILGKTLTEKNWHSDIRPGFSIKMSIMIKTLSVGMGRCPRGCESIAKALSVEESQCPTCYVVFAVRNFKQENAREFLGVKSSLQNVKQFDGQALSQQGVTLHGVSTSFQPNFVENSSDHRSGPQSLKSQDVLRENHAAHAKDKHELDFDFVGPLHYESWLRERQLEAEEIQLLKRVYIDDQNVAKALWDTPKSAQDSDPDPTSQSMRSQFSDLTPSARDGPSTTTLGSSKRQQNLPYFRRKQYTTKRSGRGFEDSPLLKTETSSRQSQKTIASRATLPLSPPGLPLSTKEHYDPDNLFQGKTLDPVELAPSSSTVPPIIVSPVPPSKFSEFQCKFCLECFVRALDLTLHLRTHAEARTFVCSTCDAAFFSQYDLNKHPCKLERENHALQDYQMQLMLLEQQNRRRLMMGRSEQSGLIGDSKTAPEVESNTQVFPELCEPKQENHALQDYQMQLMFAGAAEQEATYDSSTSTTR